VKSSRRRGALTGLKDFMDAYPKARPLIVGSDGIAIEDFLAMPLERWIENCPLSPLRNGHDLDTAGKFAVLGRLG
jgi:hypothetical protein